MNTRQNTIIDILRQKGDIRLNDLKQVFADVSEMTLRRDLDFLHRQGIIERTHGGAKILDKDSFSNQFEYSKRIIENIEAKKKIAEKALSYLEPNRSIFFDSGTTMMNFVRIIPDIKLYTITNAPNVSLTLMEKSNIEVILLGGHLDRTAVFVAGGFSLNMLEQLNIDLAFMVPVGFSLDSGFTNPYADECALKKKVIQRAKKVIMLMDHSKINKNLPFTFAGLEDVDVIITDKKPSRDILKAGKKLGNKIVY